jgi:hypothetical protein
MATETITTGIHYRVVTATGEWVHVDVSRDEEWNTWGAGVSFGAHAEETPESSLRALALQARRFADAVLGSVVPGEETPT